MSKRGTPIPSGEFRALPSGSEPPSGEPGREPSGRITLGRADAARPPAFTRRFRTRVFLYIVALVVGTSVASAAVYYSRQLGFIERDRSRRASTLLTSLATEAELGAYAGDASLCDGAARRTFDEPDVLLVAIYDRRGHEILRYNKPTLSPPAPPGPLLSNLVANVDARPERFPQLDTSGEGYDDLYAPIVTGVRDPDEVLSGAGARARRREVVGVARVGLSQTPAKEQLDEVVRWGVYLGLGLLLLGVAAALLISRRISRPIAALTRGVEELRSGALDVSVEVESGDELGTLAFSFNRMAVRLRESINALETLNRDLEAEVARRTAEIQRAAAFSTMLNAPVTPAGVAPDTGRTPLFTPTVNENDTAGGDAKGNLGRLLDGALASLIEGTGARAAMAWLTREEAVDFELEPARFRNAEPAAFGAQPSLDQLGHARPWVDGDRLLAPLMLGTEPHGCLALLGPSPWREEALRFAGHAAAQLAIAVANARAYSAAAHLARELKERNAALAKQRDQLQEMNRLKSEFLASISHELRTPLNAIIGYAELIGDGIYGDVSGEQKTALLGIDESGKNLLMLINQILDLSKIEAGKMTVHLEEVDIPELVRAVVGEAIPLAKDRPYKPQVLHAPAVRIRSDGAKLKQILTNLVSNAVKFTPRGRVDVSIRAELGGGCTIAVRDTGIGIRAEDMQIIFEEFRQVDGSYTRTFGGTGLGLAIAKRFVELLGGQITVESRVGLGSTFAIKLPKEPPAGAPPPPVPPPHRRSPTLPPPVPAAARREVKPS